MRTSSKDMSYFDDPDNPVGVLTNRLASDASNIQSATGTRVANVLKNFMTLFVSLVIGFAFCWQVALMSLLFLPIIGIANMLAIRQLSGTGADDTKAALEACQNQVSESIRHIKEPPANFILSSGEKCSAIPYFYLSIQGILRPSLRWDVKLIFKIALMRVSNFPPRNSNELQS